MPFYKYKYRTVSILELVLAESNRYFFQFGPLSRIFDLKKIFFTILVLYNSREQEPARGDQRSGGTAA